MLPDPQKGAVSFGDPKCLQQSHAISLILGRGISGSVFGGAKGKTDLPKVVDWYMNGDIMVDELVTHTMKLEDINEGYDLMRRGESIRTAIVL